MFSHTATAIDFADKFTDLIRDQSEWSQRTFGSDNRRGPTGALKHLKKEAQEAVDAYAAAGLRPGQRATPEVEEELADCLLLLLDASRRLLVKPMQLVEAAQRKMEVNKQRKWPTPTTDEPVEHLA